MDDMNKLLVDMTELCSLVVESLDNCYNNGHESLVSQVHEPNASGKLTLSCVVACVAAGASV